MNVAGVTHRGAATSGLPINYIKVPYEFECTFIILLAIIDLILEIAGDVGLMNQGSVSLEEVGEKNMGSFMSARREVHRGTLPFTFWVVLKKLSSRVERFWRLSIASLASFL